MHCPFEVTCGLHPLAELDDEDPAVELSKNLRDPDDFELLTFADPDEATDEPPDDGADEPPDDGADEAPEDPDPKGEEVPLLPLLPLLPLEPGLC